MKKQWNEEELWGEKGENIMENEQSGRQRKVRQRNSVGEVLEKEEAKHSDGMIHEVNPLVLLEANLPTLERSFSNALVQTEKSVWNSSRLLYLGVI